MYIGVGFTLYAKKMKFRGFFLRKKILFQNQILRKKDRNFVRLLFSMRQTNLLKST